MSRQPTRKTGRSRNWQQRRGFALPLVLLLALVVTIAAAFILERQSNAALAVTRHTRLYRDHHLAAGVREILEQWLLTGGNDIFGRVEEEGRAFELELPRGQKITVYLEDAQGSALTDLSTLDGPRARSAAQVLQALELATAAPSRVAGAARTRAHASGSLYRAVGPLAISIHSAPEPVLDAVASITEAPERARAALRDVSGRRQRGQKISRTDLEAAINAARLPPRSARQLSDLLTAEPVLWRVTIETRWGATAGARTERTVALVQTPTPSQNIGPASVVVLSWEDDRQESGR